MEGLVKKQLLCCRSRKDFWESYMMIRKTIGNNYCGKAGMRGKGLQKSEDLFLSIPDGTRHQYTALEQPAGGSQYPSIDKG